MSRIQSIAPIYQQKTSKTKNSGSTYGQNPNFTAAASVEKDIIEGVGKKIDESFASNPFKKSINKLSNLLDRNQGEIQSQMINAVFTTTLAPFFIAYNPFSTQDKKTKEYTALRQPISAAVAITGGFALTSLTNSYVELLGSEGSFGKFIDMRIVPDKNYLKHQFSSAYKAADDKKAFLDSVKPDKFDGPMFDSSGKPTAKYKKACIPGYVKQVHTQREKLFSTLMSENPNNITIDETTKVISSNGKEIGKNIPNLDTKVSLEKYLKENNLHNFNFGKILQDEFKFEFFKDGKIKPYALDKNLGDIKAMDFLRKIGLFEKGQVDEEELSRFMADTRISQKTIGGYKKAFNDSVWRNADGPKILGKTQGKDTSRSIQSSVGEAAYKAESVNLRQLFERLGLEGKALQDLVDTDAHTVLGDFANKYLKGLRVAGSTFTKNQKEEFKEVFKDKTTQDFAKNIVKNKIEKMGSYFKNFKSYTGIFFNVFIVAITCTALNWVYPRIVERAFPSLVKDDKAKGGNK